MTVVAAPPASTEDVGFPFGVYTGNPWFLIVASNKGELSCVGLSLQTERWALAGKPYPLRPDTKGKAIFFEPGKRNVSELAFRSAGRQQLALIGGTHSRYEKKPRAPWTHTELACSATVDLDLKWEMERFFAGSRLFDTLKSCERAIKRENAPVLKMADHRGSCLEMALIPLFPSNGGFIPTTEVPAHEVPETPDQ